MTVSTLASSATFLGNGSTAVFSASINNGVPFNSTTSLASYTVTYTDLSGVVTTLDPSTYSLSFTPAVTGKLWGIGVQLTYPLVGSPIASGTSLFLSRIFPLQQLVSISNQGDFSPENIEAMGDIEEMQLQQIAARTTQFRGLWLTNESYGAGDIVQDGPNGNDTKNYYLCQIPNLSGVWSTDLAAGDWVVSVLASVPSGGTTITLTGDVTASALISGSIPTTLATVNSNVGSFTNASITVDGKGRVLAAASGGGGGGGTVTSVRFVGDGVVTTSTPSAAVTTSGNVTATLLTQVRNTVLAGPASGSNAAPTMRALVAADLPIATSSVVGGVKPDGTIITVSGAGAITVPKASSSVFGVVEVDNTTITASAGVISAVTTQMTALAVGSIILAFLNSGTVAAGSTSAAAGITTQNMFTGATIGGSSPGDSITGTWRALQTATGVQPIVLWQRVA